ncbi:MAG TPA: LysM peptidoglycan-binding domain-containing protein [Chthoniobacterales bacterium]|nr:LysM peptidoglycan-binding domain-containing protein [Chthoniobacterales bacterium]
MKLPTLLTRKKLRATTARRSLGAPDEMDYEEMSEPNMKLSRALLIVLVLHVVAVAGIIAFNTIKSRQGSIPASVSGSNSSSQPAPAKSQAPNVAATETAAPSAPVVKPVAKEERKAIPVKPAPESTVAKTESKKTYVVAKGDNPVSIARKFKISSDDLLAANKIDDPHKLKIGQKLIIPTKATKPKKGD